MEKISDKPNQAPQKKEVKRNNCSLFSHSNKTVIIIAGPTASGKTAAAIEVARHFKTEIISADSRQCFRELRIGVARPSDEELQAVQHHFIASHSVTDEVNAATFEQYALEKTTALFQQHDVVVMTGGTGLYLRAFCEGLDQIPATPIAIRDAVKTGYELHGLQWLQQQLQEKDPAFYAAGETQNPQRSMRALEVVMATGQSIGTFQKGAILQRDFNICKLALELPRAELYNRINNRVEQMMAQGLLEEVRSLLPLQHLNALQTVGYSELFDHLQGKTSLPRAIELIQQHTRQYAKRQITWFKREAGMEWCAPGGVMAMIRN